MSSTDLSSFNIYNLNNRYIKYTQTRTSLDEFPLSKRYFSMQNSIIPTLSRNIKLTKFLLGSLFFAYLHVMNMYD